MESCIISITAPWPCYRTMIKDLVRLLGEVRLLQNSYQLCVIAQWSRIWCTEYTTVSKSHQKFMVLKFVQAELEVTLEVSIWKLLNQSGRTSILWPSKEILKLFVGLTVYAKVIDTGVYEVSGSSYLIFTYSVMPICPLQYQTQAHQSCMVFTNWYLVAHLGKKVSHRKKMKLDMF